MYIYWTLDFCKVFDKCELLCWVAFPFEGTPQFLAVELTSLFPLHVSSFGFFFNMVWKLYNLKTSYFFYYFGYQEGYNYMLRSIATTIFPFTLHNGSILALHEDYHI